MRSRLMVAGALVLGLFSSQSATAETQWLPNVVARGDLQRQIESTPIEQRPNRPLHFYGNTVRRAYYRGNPLPQRQDFIQTGRMLTKAIR